MEVNKYYVSCLFAAASIVFFLIAITAWRNGFYWGRMYKVSKDKLPFRFYTSLLVFLIVAIIFMVFTLVSIPGHYTI